MAEVRHRGWFEPKISVGSIIAVLAAFGSAAGVWSSLRVDISSTTVLTQSNDRRLGDIERRRDADRAELQRTLDEISRKVGEIQVALATKQDIRDRDDRRTTRP